MEAVLGAQPGGSRGLTSSQKALRELNRMMDKAGAIARGEREPGSEASSAWNLDSGSRFSTSA